MIVKIIGCCCLDFSSPLHLFISQSLINNDSCNSSSEYIDIEYK